MKKENEEILETGRHKRRGHFQPELRDELINAIESGTPRSVIVYQYGVSRTAISKWMRDHSSEAYQIKCGSHLTEAERISIAGQLERGELTVRAASKAHGISGDTLNKWLKASMKKNAELAACEPLDMKSTPAEPGMPDAEKEALKKALEEAEIKIRALNTLIDVAEDQFKIKIRKKAGARQS